MNFFLIIALLALVSADQWAIILVGSKGYANYRHQADGCHAYQLHKAHGIPEDHIILLSYDDVAGSTRNPFPGQLFNQPGENPPDVYDGCKATYSGDNVLKSVYMSVLTGDKETITNVTGIKNPVVLESTAEDTVFLSFFDHGGPDIICLPDYDFLTSADIMKTFRKMYQKKMYKKLVYYMEACYSGSMFVELRDNMNIYAVTAANDEESSWGYYCDDTDTVKGKDLSTCLGDLFSITWLEDTDLNNRDETLTDQWKQILNRTDLSHPQQFGDKSWLDNKIWDFIGNGNNNNIKSLRVQPKNPRVKSFKSAIKSEDIYMTYLQNEIKKSRNEKERSEFISVLKEEENYRRVTDNRFNLLVNKVTNGNEIMKSKIMSKTPNYHANKQCYFDLIKARKTYCGETREYTLSYYPTLMNLCGYNNGNSLSIINSMKEVCRAIPY